MAFCGTPHPEDSHILCDKHQDNHEYHSGFDRRALRGRYQDWPNAAYIRPPETSEAQVGQRLKNISDRFKAARP